MVMASGALKLNAEKRLTDRLAGVLRGVSVLNVVQGPVVNTVPLGLQQLTHPGIIGDVLLEPAPQPGLEAVADAGVVARRVAAEQNHVPNIGLVLGETRISQQ